MYDGGVRDNVPRHVDVTWSQLVELLTTHRQSSGCAQAPCQDRQCPAKLAHPAWSPVDIGARRRNSEVTAITVGVFDLDHVSSEDRVVEIVDTLDARGLSWIVYSTHSHRDDDICLRLVIPFSRPVLPREWARVRRAIVDELNLPADPSTGDYSRLYMLPDAPSWQREPVAAHRDGQPLDVDALIRRPASVSSAAAVAPSDPDGASTDSGVVTDLGKLAELLRKHTRPENRAIVGRALRGESLAPRGEQDTTLQRLMSTVAFCLPNDTPDDAILHLLRPCFVATDWGEGPDHLAQEALKKLRRARERKIARDAQRAEANRAIDELLGIRVRGDTPAISDEGVEDPDAWSADLVRKDGSRVGDSNEPVEEGGLRNNEANIDLILRKSREWRGKLRFNLVSKKLELHDPPAGISSTDPEGLDVELCTWLQRSPWAKKGINPRPGLVQDVLRQVVRTSSYDPLKEWLESLVWDGTPRVDSFFEQYFGATQDDPEYVRVISRRWLLSAVSRGLQPGEKVDTVLILEGRQGLRKSTAVETLFAPYFCDSKIDITNKDTWMLAGQYWGIELAELEALQGRQRETVKAFFSRRTDTFRPPYGKVNVTTPRRSVFVATTNSKEYLGLDPSGYRRFWPIACTQIDIEALRRDRDQILAEAVAIYRTGEQHWLTDEEAELARAVTAERQEVVGETWQDRIRQWFLSRPAEQRPVHVGMSQILCDVLGIDVSQITRSKEMEAATVLQAMGFGRVRVGPARVRMWSTPSELLTEPRLLHRVA